MKILILGGDGYLGWPTAMHLAKLGHEVTVADNYLRRHTTEATDSMPLFEVPTLSERCNIFQDVTGIKINNRIIDLSSGKNMYSLVRDVMPDTIIHYAEQPSAPYSMRGFDEANLTFQNNLNVTFNCIWAVKDLCPKCHIVKLGTMGEYGTPNIDIEEGWIDIQHNGREGRFLYPRAASSLYHTTKVLDTDLLWFYVRTYGLKVTDLMQGPVYGLITPETAMHSGLLPHFNYDDIFGTVVNRFLVQAVAGVPLTVYGSGGQTRGYLNLNDTLQCVTLACERPASEGELRIFNQFTETFTVNALAEMVQEAAAHLEINVEIEAIPNPRKEMEEHYYNPKSTGLLDLGLKPNFMTSKVLVEMLELIMSRKSSIDDAKIFPRVKWS